METAWNVGNNGIRARCAVIRLETEEEVSTRQEQTDDKVLKSLSPLINSMRLFGLYFNRSGNKVHPASEASSGRRLRRCQYWNPSRIYATVMLVVTWLNTARYFIVFNDNETLGVDLFIKILWISELLFVAVLCTAYYVASHTGSLDRVLRQVTLSTADISPKYSRRAAVLTFACWTLMAADISIRVYEIFINGQTNDATLILYFNTFRVSKPYEYVIKVVFIVIQVHVLASSTFPQAIASNCVASFATLCMPNPKSRSNFSRPVKLSEFEVLPRVSSSNELHCDEFALRSVQQVEQRIQQMYRRSRRVSRQL